MGNVENATSLTSILPLPSSGGTIVDAASAVTTADPEAFVGWFMGEITTRIVYLEDNSIRECSFVKGKM